MADNRFHTLENVTVDRVAALCKGPEFVEGPRKRPVFIFLIGCPGAGKTSMARKKINELEGNGFYEQMYNVSLDTIVENIKPFRNYTVKTYKDLTANRVPTDQNMDELSKYYLQVVQTTKSDFLLPYLNSERRKKLGLSPGEYPANYSIPASKSVKAKSPNAAPNSLAAPAAAAAAAGANGRYEMVVNAKKRKRKI
jgi:hypothetical protein